MKTINPKTPFEKLVGDSVATAQAYAAGAGMAGAILVMVGSMIDAGACCVGGAVVGLMAFGGYLAAELVKRTIINALSLLKSAMKSDETVH